MSEYPYDDDRGATHWEGCWRARRHHNCAVRRAEELEREHAFVTQGLDGMRSDRDDWRQRAEAAQRRETVLQDAVNALIKRPWYVVDEGQADIVEYVQVTLKAALKAADGAERRS